ncbi:fucose isomerase [Candidatus Bathyarchaeota archaeon]|nr:fucose isomerase [Candidatus Bathyarchaeota archaeon]
MSKQQVSIGVACLARKTFDYRAASSLYGNIQKDLACIDAVDFTFIDDLVIDLEDAISAAKIFSGASLDGVILISGTFHLGHLALTINAALRKPILLWALEELPYDGGKIRLNSVCGLNLDASNLYKAGVDGIHYTIGDSVDETWIDAIRINRALESAKIGLAGYHASGFFNIDVDELDLYKETGIMVEHVELTDLFHHDIPSEQLSYWKGELTHFFDTSELSDEQVENVAKLCHGIKVVMESKDLSALAIRCWPEFASMHGIAPCGAMSILQSKGMILACEGDILAAATMIAHAAIGAKTPFLADFSQVNFDEDFALLWHCGVAPCNTWDGKCKRSLDTYFAAGKGVTAGFVLKPGHVSICRIDYGRQSYRIFLQEGEGIPMEKKLKGTYLKVIFPGEGTKNVLDKIISNGIAHHVSMVHGNYMEAFKILAKIKGWQVIT